MRLLRLEPLGVLGSRILSESLSLFRFSAHVKLEVRSKVKMPQGKRNQLNWGQNFCWDWFCSFSVHDALGKSTNSFLPELRLKNNNNNKISFLAWHVSWCWRGKESMNWIFEWTLTCIDHSQTVVIIRKKRYYIHWQPWISSLYFKKKKCFPACE